jgi:hypothetical protein
MRVSEILLVRREADAELLLPLRLGAADPYTARERIITADPVRMSNLDVLEDWYIRYKDRPVSFTDIRSDKRAVYESLLKQGTWDGYHARWILRRIEGQTIGGYTLRRMGGRSQFQVLKAGESQGELNVRTEVLPATAEGPPLPDDNDGRMPF